MERVSFLNEGQRIDATLAVPKNSQALVPGVIFLAGMISDKSGYIPYAERLAELGIAALAVSTRGRGESEGDFDKLTVWDRVGDGLAAYDFLRNYPGIDGARIGMCGASVGGAISSIVASERDVKSLLLRAPSTYTDEMMQMTLAQTMTIESTMFKSIKDIPATPAVKAIRQFQGDLLVVVSGKDAIIPVEIPKCYMSEATGAKRAELITMEQAEHGLKEEEKSQFSDILVNWFKETL
jgi:uncharacterized protein